MWQVYLTRKAFKQKNDLPQKIREILQALTDEMRHKGPLRYTWKNFGKLEASHNLYHCHIKSGKPTYVVCWKVEDKTIKIIEVYYVGTHEKAPY